MDQDLLSTAQAVLHMLPQGVRDALTLSALLALGLALCAKPIALRYAGPPEHWSPVLRVIFSALDVVAINSATIWRLAQLGLAQRALRAATTPAPGERISTLLELDDAGHPLSHPLEGPPVPWAESAPPPPPPPLLPPKGGAS